MYVIGRRECFRRIDNQEALEELIWAIEASEGRFYIMQQSLTFWQQVGAGLTDNVSRQTDNITKPAPIDPNVETIDNETKPVRINAKLKAGLLLFHIGLYYYRTTDRRKHQAINWQTSKIHLQHCLELFDQENRPDLVAKCITQLERVLRRMQAWNELEQVAQKALSLHQTYGSTSKLAQDYSFLAEAALQQQRWDDACQAAQLKTRAELERDLEGLAADLTTEANKLDLVLRIFVDLVGSPVLVVENPILVIASLKTLF
ncbi:hypothetical protein [Coleofasciculus sp. G2-EDA-02]|uniref:hypothetical protein n=1 Tax=Coleofasciculus sp. G2-EDA-02 TaxID=3069529 RepID=UPI0033041397